MYRAIGTLLVCCCSYIAHCEPDWKLKKEEDGIRIFTAANPGSSLKSIRVELTVSATLNQLIAFLQDIEKQPQWVYSVHSSRLLKVVKPNELVFYSEVDLPWPCSNRDYIAHFTIEQPSPGILTIESYAEPDFLPAQKGLVRVHKSNARWKITSLSESVQSIVYMLDFDPGGAIPAWLVNLFLTKGPYHTFHNLSRNVGKPEYKNRVVPFLKVNTP